MLHDRSNIMAENPNPGAEQAESAREKDSIDAVIEVYKRDVDRTLLRENLKLTVEKRLRKLQEFVRFSEEMRRAGAKQADKG
jgi:hypothetical protein